MMALRNVGIYQGFLFPRYDTASTCNLISTFQGAIVRSFQGWIDPWAYRSLKMGTLRRSETLKCH